MISCENAVQQARDESDTLFIEFLHNTGGLFGILFYNDFSKLDIRVSPARQRETREIVSCNCRGNKTALAHTGGKIDFSVLERSVCVCVV